LIALKLSATYISACQCMQSKFRLAQPAHNCACRKYLPLKTTPTYVGVRKTWFWTAVGILLEMYMPTYVVPNSSHILSLYLSICLSLYLSIYLSIYLSFFIFSYIKKVICRGRNVKRTWGLGWAHEAYCAHMRVKGGKCQHWTVPRVSFKTLILDLVKFILIFTAWNGCNEVRCLLQVVF
jgi:hypothetical protein